MNDQDRDTAEAIFGELLYSYSRADAIRDGVLVDDPSARNARASSTPRLARRACGA